MRQTILPCSAPGGSSASVTRQVPNFVSIGSPSSGGAGSSTSSKSVQPAPSMVTMKRCIEAHDVSRARAPHCAVQDREGKAPLLPNKMDARPGESIDFYSYDPLEKDWYVYGRGTVTPDGTQVRFDP